MPPHSSADHTGPPQTPEQIATAIADFLHEHSEAAVLEDGKVLFDLRSAQHSLDTEHGRCTLHLWNDERNIVRRVLSAAPRNGSLRLATQRFGHAQPKLLELVSSPERRTPSTREATRARYMRLLERVLAREFPEWKPEGFRTAMDLERSFGPAYARGWLARGNQAWAVIGVSEHENASIVEGILTLGILWLHHCRESAGGRRLYQGLRIIVPRGMAMLTLSRLAWLNHDAAQWELHELDEKTEELQARDADDTGNLRTRLVHHPDQALARDRFAVATAKLLDLVPERDRDRVEPRLRSSTELAFLLHGLEFARAQVKPAANSFAHEVAITVGADDGETPLTESNHEELAYLVADLFRRRRASVPATDFTRRGQTPGRRIGAHRQEPAHSRLRGVGREQVSDTEQVPAQDPLYRAAPERWLESMLRRDLAPLTRGIAADARAQGRALQRIAPHTSSEEEDDDTRGNRAHSAEGQRSSTSDPEGLTQVVPRLDPQHVYSQVPAIAGVSDRGMLDLLGVTADGRLAVIELKADDDLHFPLQGLDYWIRVRHHHLQTADVATGLGEFQRHGYFRDVELSPSAPRLYLVAPALHIHPATETILRYFSPRVEWHLVALDERWRDQVRVVWRKSTATF